MKGILFSDLHLDVGQNFERTKEAIKFTLDKFRDYDEKPAIFFLGDYATSPWEKIEYNGKVVRCVDIVASWIDTFRMAGFLVLAVPGNHDTGRNGIFFDEGYAREVVTNVLKEEYPCVDRISKQSDTPDGINYYHHQAITLIGINTVAGSDDTFMAAGKIGKEQLKKIEEILGKCQGDEIILYLHHHPVNRGAKSVSDVGMELVDGPELMALCAKYRVRLIAHGHKHSMTGEIMRGCTSLFNGGSVGETGRVPMFTLADGCFFASLDIMGAQWD